MGTEEGYQILTHNDRADLKPGQYLLETPKPQPAFAREISKETRAYVLDRNGFTCQMCGAVAGEPHPYDPTRKTRLHIGHIIDKSLGGSDEPANLRAICSVCNEGASNVTLTRPDLQKLLVQIRRATTADQLEVLEWLRKKFKAFSPNPPAIRGVDFVIRPVGAGATAGSADFPRGLAGSGISGGFILSNSFSMS